MSTVTVRISTGARDALKQMSAAAGEPMPAILDKAIEHYRRKQFLEGLNEDFARLRRDPKAWQEELKERAQWDATLADDLDDE